jgi:subtilisin-like proprotein convertase family protein
VTIITNSFGTGAPDFGSVLVGERIGPADPAFATNTIPAPFSTNAVLTIGAPGQWHFYVFTNSTDFTNAVFLTFLPEPLSTFPVATNLPASTNSALSWSATPDLDLYVSHDPALTNLDAAAIAAADMSLGRGGTETLIYSNATPGVYYVGVKCESTLGAQYGFVADASLEPFVQSDPHGNQLLRGFPRTAMTTGGTPSTPAVAYLFHVTPDAFPVRRVIVTNVLSSASLPEAQLALTRQGSTVWLLNHSAAGSAPATNLVFDDSAEGDLPGAQASAGPGTLRDFEGRSARGLWLLDLQTTNQPISDSASSILLEPQSELIGGVIANLLPGACREDYLPVPLQASNLTVTVDLGSGTGPLSLQVCPFDSPLSNCPTLQISAANSGNALVVDQTSQPPLHPGAYRIRTCNLGPDIAGITVQAAFPGASIPPVTNFYTSSKPLNLTEAGVSDSTLAVTNSGRVISVEVGVRLDHPRVSDLVLSLVGPDGARILLQDSRGGASTAGLGANQVLTNTTPVDFFGGPEAVTNTFDTGETFGTILIQYDFFKLPDEMSVFYETNLLYDSGPVSLTGSTNLQYGPGNSTSFTIVMNQGGNSETNTAWHYSVTTAAIEPLYLTFTEDTNLATIPIKFAPTPFTNLTVAPVDGPLEPGIFYRAEESMNRLVGKSAAGLWTLEVWDRGAGGSNPPPVLRSWQLALVVGNPAPAPVVLLNNVAATNLVGPGQVQWYAIDVPEWASFATNSLLSSTAPINLLFNASAPPTGTNVGDVSLAAGATTGNWVLRTNAPPPLMPGSRYYLGLQNTNATTVSLSLVVGFDVETMVTLNSGVPYANATSGPLGSADFYRYVASTNAARVQFEINSPSGDVTLVARQGPPPPNLGSYDFISANPGTNDELIVVYDYSKPVSLAAGAWFLTVVNVTGRPASYSIMATEFPVYGTNLMVSQPTVVGNSMCVSWNSLPGVHYYVQGKVELSDPVWTFLSPTLTAADVTTSFCLPLPSSYQYFRVCEGIVLAPALPIIDALTELPSGMMLSWNAPTNTHYQVQWSPSLAPVDWRNLGPSLNSTTGIFFYIDDGTQTGGLLAPRFYRLEQLP